MDRLSLNSSSRGDSFAVVQDSNADPMVFTSGEGGHLCLVVKGASGHKEVIDLSKNFGFSQQQTLRTLAVYQWLDGTIHLIFAIQEIDKADQLFVLRPVSARVAEWQALTGRGHFYDSPQGNDIFVREIILGKSDGSGSAQSYPQVHVVFQQRTLLTEDIMILAVDSRSKSWFNPHKFKLPVSPGIILSACIGNLSMYRGMFVLYQDSKLVGSKVSLRFVGLDPGEETPALQSIEQLVPEGATQIATFDNVDGLTDLLIAGKQLSWLSAEACIHGHQKPIVIDDSIAYTSTTQLKIGQTNDVVSVWILTSSSLLSCQELAITSPSIPPTKKTEATPLINQDRKSDRFASFQNPRSGQKPIVITRYAVITMLDEAWTFAHAPEINAAREVYIRHLDEMLQLYEELDAKLSQVEAASQAANTKLNEVHTTLETHIKQSNATATAGSATSIVGGVMLIFCTPVGIAMLAAGAITAIGAPLVQGFLFDEQASSAITKILKDYHASSHDLHEHFDKIEKMKQAAIGSLLAFLAILHTHPFPEAPVRTQPKVPGEPAFPPDHPYHPNGFSNLALTGITGNIAGKEFVEVGGKFVVKALGETGGKTLVKFLPMLGKGVPVLGILLDIGSIVQTWTSTNETLQHVDTLRTEIMQNFLAFREAVRNHQTILEQEIGKLPLQNSLRKLIKLRRPPPRGPPMNPQTACGLMALFEGMVGVSVMLFAGLHGDSHDDPDEDQYMAEVMPESDVHELSQNSMAAPVVDSLYEHYPDSNAPDEKKKDHDEDGIRVGSVRFRITCLPVPFGHEDVFNVSGSSKDKRGNSWIGFWTHFMTLTSRGGCSKCKIEPSAVNGDTHSDAHKRLVGGHMETVIQDTYWYIIPICQKHNAPSGTYDRYPNGRHLETKHGTWAVRIPPKP